MAKEKKEPTHSELGCSKCNHFDAGEWRCDIGYKLDSKGKCKNFRPSIMLRPYGYGMTEHGR